MVAGCLAKSGRFMGDDLYPGRISNPKGFFESADINRVNENILAQVVPGRPRIIGRYLFRDRPLMWQRWLARVPVGMPILTTPEIDLSILKLVEREPYCYKDPRFSYTLPVWRPHLNNTSFICVFRDPTQTASSIVMECSQADYLQSISINYNQALELWNIMYEHILTHYQIGGNWLFLHYDQMFENEGLERLQEFTGALIDVTFPDQSLRRSLGRVRIPLKSEGLYRELNTLSHHDP